MLCLSAEKALKKNLLECCLSGHDVIDTSENLKPRKINNSWGDRRNTTHTLLNLLLLEIHAYSYLIASSK
jgi:hypothetical protein